tara:strand:- start:275 stop:487 length:213 start_codon:yes stop_codon:yes gene_type:complete
MSIDHRPVAPSEVIYNLRALAAHMRRNARLLERMYTDAALARAAELHSAATIPEGWAAQIEAEQTREDAA